MCFPDTLSAAFFYYIISPALNIMGFRKELSDTPVKGMDPFAKQLKFCIQVQGMCKTPEGHPWTLLGIMVTGKESLLLTVIFLMSEIKASVFLPPSNYRADTQWSSGNVCSHVKMF